MYYQIENGEDINKIYQPPYPSGAGNIPYTFGWSNKYAPKPYGLSLTPTLYSYYANPGFTRIITANEPGFATQALNEDNNNYFAGPLNGIYEVEVSGIQNLPDASGGCVKADSLNRKYLLYFIRGEGSDDNDQLDNPLGAINGRLFNRVRWFSRTCNKNHPINICNINYLVLDFGTNITYLDDNNNGFQAGYVPGSGDLNLNFRMLYSTQSIPPQGNVSQNQEILFGKNFGYVEGTNRTYTNNKPYMMDGSHYLYPTGINSVVEYGVDLTNAVAIVKPYKSDFYDVKNADRNFYSGEAFPIWGNAQFQGTFANEFYMPDLDFWAGSYTDDPDSFLSDFPFFYSPTNYYARNSGYNQLIGYTGNNASGLYHFIPYTFDLSINNVTQSGQRNNCRSCRDFFAKNKVLRINNLTHGGNPNEATYVWRTPSKLNGFSNIGNTTFSIDFSYYNICDNACNSIGTTSSIHNRLYNSFDYGPCNNFIELDIVESGIPLDDINGYNPTSLSGNALVATLYFGGIYESGHAFNKAGIISFSKKKLTKTICWNNNGTRCYVPASSLFVPLGLQDFFDENLWNNNWKLEDNQERTPLIEDYLDVTNYCNFSSGNVILHPQQLPATPCASVNCTLCDGRYVPQSVNITIGSFGNFILSKQHDGFSITTPLYGGKRYCSWSYSNGSGTDLTLTYQPFDINFILGGTVGIFNVTTILSGAIQHFVDYRLNCNNPINNDANPTPYAASATFTDLYDILDYV